MTTKPRRLDRALIVKSEAGHELIKANTTESQQIKDTLKGLYGEHGIMRPPFPFAELAELLTVSTPHYRAAKQKAADVAGLGWDLTPIEDAEGEEGENEEALKAERSRVRERLMSPNPDHTLREVLESVAFDYEAFGWGFLELVLNGADELQEVRHVPGHTMRAHKDGNKYVQVRGNDKVWFIDVSKANIWGEGDEPRKHIDVETGDITDEEPENPGNPIIPFIHYTPLSSFYGLPDYIPAIGAITTNKALRDFNLGFIDHNTVPHYAVLVQGAELDEELEEDILSYFRDHVKGQQRATLVVPIPYADDEVTVTFEKLGSDVEEGGFLMLKDSNTTEILMAHGVPPYRVAWAVSGSLAGALGKEMDEIYKNAVVESRQDVIEDRFNRYVIHGALDATRHEFVLTDLDLSDRSLELELAKAMVEYGIMTPAEAREEILGKERDASPDVFYISASLVRVDDPTPTPEEAEREAAKRGRRAELTEAIKEMRDFRKHVEAMNERRNS